VDLKKRVLVIVRGSLATPRAAQGLRSAVGYAALGLEVTVLLCGPQPADADPTGVLAQAQAQRHLQTLRALGHTVVSDEAGARLLGRCDKELGPHAVVVW
jgi:hypothetical protein